MLCASSQPSTGERLARGTLRSSSGRFARSSGTSRDHISTHLEVSAHWKGTPISTSASKERLAQPAFVAAAAIAVVLAFSAVVAFGGASAQAQPTGTAVSAESVPADPSDPVPFYIVQSSADGQPEFLFEIAQRFLGDGNRFNEIFDLNKGRKQPDGGALTVPTSLDPGWVLQLPADAQGAGLQVGPLPGGSQPTASTSPSPSVASTPSAKPAPTVKSSPRVKPSPRSSQPAITHTSSTAAATTGVPAAVWIIIIVIVVLAGAAAAGYIFFRRRKASAAAPDAHFVAADRSASWTIDSALKVLTSACEEEQIRFPGLYLVTVDASSINVLLSTPSAKVPSGWTASSDGRTWTASLAYLQGQRVPEVSNEQFSGLATLGTSQTGRLLLDFRQANGPISVEGSSSAVTDVVEGWLSELASNPWSGSPKIVRLGARGTAQQETLEGFLERLDGADEGIAVLDSAPTRTQGEALRALYSAPDFRWIIIVKSAYAGASWKFTARDGLLTSGFVPDVHYSTASSRPPESVVAPS